MPETHVRKLRATPRFLDELPTVSRFQTPAPAFCMSAAPFCQGARLMLVVEVDRGDNRRPTGGEQADHPHEALLDRVEALVPFCVERLELRPGGIVLPSWVVTAVAEVPGGASPSYAHDYYERDNAFYRRWDAIARDRATFRAWMEDNVLGTRDFAELRRKLAHATGGAT